MIGKEQETIGKTGKEKSVPLGAIVGAATPRAALGQRVEMGMIEGTCRVESIAYTYMHITYCMYAMSQAALIWLKCNGAHAQGKQVGMQLS